MTDKLALWKHAFADCMRNAISKDDFSDYEDFDLGKNKCETDEELEAFYEEENQMFLAVFGEPIRD